MHRGNGGDKVKKITGEKYVLLTKNIIHVAPRTTPRPRWRPRMARLSSILCCRPRHWPRRPRLRPHQVRSNRGLLFEVSFCFYALLVLAACFWKEMGRFNSSVGVEEALKFTGHQF